MKRAGVSVELDDRAVSDERDDNARHSGDGWQGAKPSPRKYRSTLNQPRLRQSFPKSDCATSFYCYATTRRPI